jgi:MoaA/NifB/PqqE/SkfB family radical SAM enzyme
MIGLNKYISLFRKKPQIIPKAFKGMFLAHLANRRILRGVELAVTYDCQGACPKCSCRSLVKKGQKKMSLEQLYSLCLDISDSGAILINFTGGEPLLRKGIVKLIGRVSKLSLLTSLSTNGLLLTDKMIDRLAYSGLNIIQISLNSPFKDEHDKEIGVVGSYDKVLAGIRKAKERGIEVLINVVATKEIIYSGKIYNFIEIARLSNSFLSLIFPAAAGGWRNKDVCLNKKDYEQLKDLLNYSFVTTDTESSYKRGFCPAGTEKIYISPYGDVYPCPFIQTPIGHVLKENFSKILKNNSFPKVPGCLNIRS